MSATSPFTMSAKGTATLLTEVCRLSHPHLAEKHQNPKYPASEPKYESQLIFEPVDTATIWAAIVAVAKLAWPAMTMPDGSIVDGETLLRNGVKKTPLHSGVERPQDAAYFNKFYISAKSSDPVPLVGPDGVTPLQASAFYAGCYVRAFIGVFVFKGGDGIGIGLNALQFVRDGERLDNKAGATAAFAASPLPGNLAAPAAAPAYAQQPAYAAPAQPAAIPAASWQQGPTGQPIANAPVYAQQPAPGGQAPAMPGAAPNRGVALPPGVG